MRRSVAAPVVKARAVSRPLRVAVYNGEGRFAGLVFPGKIRTEIVKGAAPKGKGGVLLCAVFDENGSLLGVIDPADLMPVDSGGKAAADPDPAAPPAPAAGSGSGCSFAAVGKARRPVRVRVGR